MGAPLNTSLANLSPESRLKAVVFPPFAESLRAANESGEWEADYQLDRVPKKERAWTLTSTSVTFIGWIVAYYFVFALTARWITRDDDGHLLAYVRMHLVRLAGYFIGGALSFWSSMLVIQHGEKQIVLAGALISYLLEVVFWVASMAVLKSHYVITFTRSFCIVFMNGLFSFLLTTLIIGSVLFAFFALAQESDAMFSWLNTRIEYWVLEPLQLI